MNELLRTIVAEVVAPADMTMADLLAATKNRTDQKLEQLRQYVADYPEIGKMSAWEFLRSAFRQVECPGCSGRNVPPNLCRYCAGTGQVDLHLTSHPMNVHAIALEMRGRNRKV